MNAKGKNAIKLDEPMDEKTHQALLAQVTGQSDPVEEKDDGARYGNRKGLAVRSYKKSDQLPTR